VGRGSRYFGWHDIPGCRLRPATVRNGGSGAFAQGANAFVTLRDSTVAWNATGLTTTAGGAILSTQNNLIGGNLSSSVTPTNVGLQ